MSIDLTVLTLAVRNLVRQRTRTTASLCAIGIGVACLIVASGFVKNILFQLGEATIHSQTGHIQIASPTYWQTNNHSGSAITIGNFQEIKTLLANDPRIDQIAARMNFVGMLNNGKRDLGIIAEGVEPDPEAGIGSFMHFVDGHALGSSDRNGIVIGEGVARTLDIKIGDYVTLVATLAEGALNTAEFRVTGIFRSFSKEFDARAVRIPLLATTDLLGNANAHLIVATLNNTTDTKQFITEWSPKLEKLSTKAKSWMELSDFYEKTVQLYDAQFGILRLIIFFMVLLSVTNSINMSLFERTREFGTLLAIGFYPSTVYWQILLESLILGIFGSLFGMVIALTVSWAVSFHGIPMPPPPNANIGYLAHIQLDAVSVMLSMLIGVASTLLASIIPARRASHLPIIDALRHGV